MTFHLSPNAHNRVLPLLSAEAASHTLALEEEIEPEIISDGPFVEDTGLFDDLIKPSAIPMVDVTTDGNINAWTRTIKEENPRKRARLIDDDVETEIDLKPEELWARIETFIAARRAIIDASNIREFKDGEGCARSSTARIDRTVQMTRVLGGIHDMPPPKPTELPLEAPISKDIVSSTSERINTMEIAFGLTPTDEDLPSRVKRLEKRVLELEALSGGSLWPLVTRLEAAEKEAMTAALNATTSAVHTYRQTLPVPDHDLPQDMDSMKRRIEELQTNLLAQYGRRRNPM